jgi:hypothetical protein
MTMVAPEASWTGEPPEVDMTLGVTVVKSSSSGTRLVLELREGSWRSRHERELEGEPFAYFSGLITEIERLDAREPTVRESNEERLLSIGTRLARDLLSEPIHARLAQRAWSPGDGSSARTLLIVTDDPWIPWETLCLSGVGHEGRFLGEAFALAVWPWDIPGCATLPLNRIGTVFPPSSHLKAAVAEQGDLETLARRSARRVEEVTPRLVPVLAALRSGDFSGLHFSGHASVRGNQPELWGFPLENLEYLRAIDLATCDLGTTRPLVFLNACRTGQSGQSLTGLGGLAWAFLEAGAGAVIGTHWEVHDRSACAFSHAFYEAFFQGSPLGEAARLARRTLRQEFPGDPAWLAYRVFGHPAARTGDLALPLPPPRRDEPGLEIPFAVWSPEKSPGALLRADYGVVPFHGRLRELEDLQGWCSGERPLAIRLYTGRGGMGKTRLALELCRRLRAHGWRCGFIPKQTMSDADQRREWVRALLGRGGPLLAVVDYAERRDELLVSLLEELAAAQDNGHYRLILLSRELGDWWERLRASPGRMRDSLMGPAVSHRPLGPLAAEPAQRAEAFRRAARAFAEQLGKAVPEMLPEDLDDDHFRVVLLLHIAALGAVEGVRLKGEDGVLDWLLAREREFWQGQVEARDIPAHLVRGVGRAMAVVTLAGGVPRPEGALELLGRLRYFGGQGIDILTEISHLLHETYPGDFWISPLQPDILGEHLIERETAGDLEAIETVFGPRRSANAPGAVRA